MNVVSTILTVLWTTIVLRGIIFDFHRSNIDYRPLPYKKE